MKLVWIILLTVFVVGLVACGSNPPPPKEPADVWLPDWWNPPEDPNYLFATATKTSRDMGLAINKATTEARNEIAKQMELRIQGLTKSFNEEVGLDEDAELLSQYFKGIPHFGSTDTRDFSHLFLIDNLEKLLRILREENYKFIVVDFNESDICSYVSIPDRKTSRNLSK